MSGTGSTSISGARAPGGSRRGDVRRPEGRRFPFGWTVHLIILALAVLLWWIARDMVSVSRTLTDAGRIEFSLSGELEGKWRVYSERELPISLEVSGPTKEINKLASYLDQRPGRYVYRYEVDQSDLSNAEVNSRRQVKLVVDIRRIRSTDDTFVTSELTVRPQTENRVFEVIIEEYVQRDAYFDLGATARGQIQLSLTRPDGRPETRTYSYTAEVEGRDIEVYGPFSLVEEVADRTGRAKLELAVDARQALENVARMEREPIEEVLRREVVSVVPLVPIEGVVVRAAGASGRPITEAAVRIRFERQQDYVQQTRDFPVEVVLPNWLAQRSGRVENLPSTVPVDMKILSSQLTSFNENNVHVRLDLGSLTRAVVANVETVEGTSHQRGRVLNWYYSLDINTDRLTYEFINERVTADQYLPVGEITIVWTE